MPAYPGAFSHNPTSSERDGAVVCWKRRWTSSGWRIEEQQPPSGPVLLVLAFRPAMSTVGLGPRQDCSWRRVKPESLGPSLHPGVPPQRGDRRRGGGQSRARVFARSPSPRFAVMGSRGASGRDPSPDLGPLTRPRRSRVMLGGGIVQGGPGQRSSFGRMVRAAWLPILDIHLGRPSTQSIPVVRRVRKATGLRRSQPGCRREGNPDTRPGC
jgi:hypothetical protein